MSRHGKHRERIATYAVEVPVDGEMKLYKVDVYFDPAAARSLAFKAATNESQQSIIGPLKAVVMEPRK